MRLVSFASGSSGNCTLIESDNTRILVDAGITRKRISQGLDKIGLTLKDIDGIVVSHEHIDHIKALGVISRNDGIQIYGTRGTIGGIKARSSLGKVHNEHLNVVDTGYSFEIGDIAITPFDTFHDTAEPCGFTFERKDRKAAVMTDTGNYDVTILDMLSNVNALLIESNHDIKMLKDGSYPDFLKHRILGDFGHMSNNLCSELLGEILNDEVEGVLLGHLSKDNNTETKALETVKKGIDDNDTDYVSKDFEIVVAKRESISKIIEF